MLDVLLALFFELGSDHELLVAVLAANVLDLGCQLLNFKLEVSHLNKDAHHIKN